MVKIKNKLMIYFLVFSLVPMFAQAHILSGTGFASGALHPLSGLDHLLAMLAVGIISVRLGGKYLLIGPSIFVSSMVAGGILGMYGLHLSFIEIGIALSVILSGIAIIFSGKLPARISISIIAIAAILHGHSHGSEISGIFNPIIYTLGFVLSTATLHLLGVGIGHYSYRADISRKFLRLVGAGISAAGLMILFGII